MINEDMKYFPSQREILRGTKPPKHRSDFRVLLVNPYHQDWAKILPLGIAYIAAVLEKNQIPVQVVDMNASAVDLVHVEKELISEFPNIIGITSTTPQYPVASRIAELTKKLNPEVKIILGGVHPSSLPEECLRDHNIDYVVRGEGEVTFIDLLKAISGEKSIEEVEGISYRTNGLIRHNLARPRIENLDDVPFPARHLFPFPSRYTSPALKRHIFADIMSSRGCPGHCTFCSRSIFASNVTMRSPQNVVLEIELLKECYGVEEIHMADDMFTFDFKRVEEFCNLMLERDLKILWACGGIRVDYITKEMLEIMKAAGCYRIGFGAESGSDEILKKMGKGITTEQLKRAFEISQQVGLPAKACFMIGNYGETKQHIEETIKFAINLKTDAVNFAITTPFPGTALYRLLDRRGWLLTKDWSKYGIYKTPVFKTDTLTPETIIRMYKKAYRRYYLRWGYFIKKIKDLKSLNDFKMLLTGLKEYFRRITGER